MKTPWILCFLFKKEAFISLLIGLGMNLLIIFAELKWVIFVLQNLGGLIHEFGHCIWAWMMGFVSLPAFNFVHRGSPTLAFGESPNWWIAGIIISWLIIMAYKIWNYKKLVSLSILMICLFNIVAILTDSYREVMIYGGHATVLIVGNIFIYRGLTNIAVHHQLERVLYFFFGIFLLINEYLFSIEIMNNLSIRAEYLKEFRTLNDMVKISDIFKITLDQSLMFHINSCFISTAITYIIYVISRRLYDL